MRDLFDRRLTDPTAADVADALRDCAAAVAAPDGRGDLPPFDADAVAHELLRRPAGHSSLPGGTPGAHVGGEIAHLSLAWWTAPGGRKLVRVRGRREPERRGPPYSSEEHAFQTIEDELAARPVIWHLDPERVVEALTAGEPEWVAACGCGAAGSAESLGWSHGMCGPCADRVAEYGPEAVSHAPGLLAADNFEPHDVAFAGDGKYVVACGSEQIHAWDAATGAPRQQASYAYYAPDATAELRLAASPVGRSVFATDGGILTPAESRAEWPFSFDLEARSAHWTGRPDELLVQSADHKLYLANAHDGHARALARPLDGRARLCALYPHAERPRAVFAWNGTAAVVRVRADGTLIEEWRFLLGHGRLNRTGMWVGGPQVVRFSPDGERLLFVRGAEIELRLPERAKALQQVEFAHPVLDAEFSPDGERVYLLTACGIHVCNPGALASVRARLRWHVGPAARLAVSPDGAALATAGAGGVKLWPVASLLPLLE